MKHAKGKPSSYPQRHRKGHGAGSAPQRKKSRPLLLLGLCIALVIGGAMAWEWLRPGRGEELWYEENVTTGSIGDGKTSVEELQRLVDGGMITLSINATPVWDLSDKEAGVNWQIENPAEQTDKLIRVEIYRQDTGQLLYETGALQPGTYVTGTQPKGKLAVGSYPCTAYFYAYDIETKDFVGQVGAQILLTVQDSGKE